MRVSTAYFSPENFFIGTTSGAEFSFGVSCCMPTVTISATDIGNNNNICYSGRKDGAAPLPIVSTAEIAVIAVAIVLVIVIVAAITGFAYIRKRRRAELAEMTSLPQQR